MNILITGHRGFIGSELMNFYIKKKNVKLSLIDADLTNSFLVDNFFNRNKIDVVIHCAIRGGRRIKEDGFDVYKNNMRMFKNFYKNKHKFNFLISFGSAAEFNKKFHIENVSENDIGKNIPYDNYGVSKYIIQKYIENDSQFLNLRIFNCFGKNETNDRFIKSNINNYFNKLPMTIFDDIIMDFFSIEDLIKVVDYFVDRQASLCRSLNLCYQEKYKLSDICSIINNLDSHKVEIKNMNMMKFNNYYGNGNLLNSIGFNFYGLKNSIERIYDNYKNKDKV